MEQLRGTIGILTLPGEGTAYEEFGRMIRGRRRELGMIQVKLAAQVRLEEKPVSAGYIHDLERGWVIPPPHVMEQLAVALELDRDLLYLAVGRLPPEVAEALKRLTPEQCTAAWRVFKRTVMEEAAKQDEPEAPPKRGGSSQR